MKMNQLGVDYLYPCSRCCVLKPREKFYKSTSESRNHRYQCKDCDRISRSSTANKDKHKAYLKQHYATNKIRYAERSRKARLLKLGVTIEMYDQMFVKQEGLCAICGSPEKIKNRRLATDHCHSTGSIRGLLCQACNTGLGKLKDCKETLLKAVKYLEFYENK